MKICVLASGSQGNSTVVVSEDTVLLVDMGIAYKTLKQALASIGLSPESITAVLVTHAHSDHFSGLNVLCRKHGTPLFASEETATAIDIAFSEYRRKYGFAFDWALVSPGSPFEIGNLSITPFEVPHDANGALAFTISNGNAKFGIATDLGTITNAAAFHLKDCNALALEMNHDSRMLMESDRTESLKKRISSRLGHLSNDQAADFLDSFEMENLQYFFPSHQSLECNEKSIVSYTLNQVRGKRDFSIVETFQDKPSQVVTL